MVKQCWNREGPSPEEEITHHLSCIWRLTFSNRGLMQPVGWYLTPIVKAQLGTFVGVLISQRKWLNLTWALLFLDHMFIYERPYIGLALHKVHLGGILYLQPPVWTASATLWNFIQFGFHFNILSHHWRPMKTERALTSENRVQQEQMLRVTQAINTGMKFHDINNQASARRPSLLVGNLHGYFRFDTESGQSLLGS